MTRFAILLSAVVGIVGSSSALAASVPIVPVNPAASTFSEPHLNGGTWAWSFELTSPVVATHVGWYDEGQNGLSHAHRIGLWHGNLLETQLLGSVIPTDGLGVEIPASTSATLDGPWRKVPIVGGSIVLALVTT